jgi:hypothetical protein
MKETYFLELERDIWVLYRESENEPFAYTITESTDINQIFLHMYRDKASRGNGNSMEIG